MRHFGSIVLSGLLGAFVYVLSGIGLVKSAQAQRSGLTETYSAASMGLAALAAAGLLYAILVLTRLSPLGPVLLGLGYLGMTAWALFAAGSLHRIVPGTVAGVRDAAWQPAGALTTLLAVPLLATIVSPRRWRRRVSPQATA